MSYFLEKLIGSSKNETIQLIGNRMTVGRCISSSIQIVSPLVSRCHAVLLFENNEWLIKDVKSINGVYVNNTRLMKDGSCTLTDKDTISLGPPDRTEFQYRYRKCEPETDVTYENERPHKIRKRDHFQNTPETLPGCVIILKNPLSPGDNHHIDVDQNSNKEAISLESQESSAAKLLPKENGVCNIEECENTSTVEGVRLGSEQTANEEKSCLSSKDASCDNLKLTVKSLRQLLASKEKEQEELKEKLLRAESKLVANDQEPKKQDEEKGKQCTQEVIRHTVTQQVGDIMETELICGICTELFVEAVTLNCSHTFCKFCIKTWKSKKRICPICRAAIKTETRALVLDNFIEKMMESLSAEMKEHRKKLIEERHSTNSSTNARDGATYETEDTFSSDFSDSGSEFSDSSGEVMTGAYYGGYGECFTCGRRGHWANGCPYF